MSDTHAYLLKRIDRATWKRAQIRALMEGTDLRAVLIEALVAYADVSIVPTTDPSA